MKSRLPPAGIFLLLAPFVLTQEGRTPDVKTYPEKQAVNQDGDAVFDCRDEGQLRAQVQWLRGNRLLESHRGRLILRQVQAHHAGTYTCRAVGVPVTVPGAEVKATLQVLLHAVTPIARRPHPLCTSMEAQCRNGECVPKEFVCDGEFDCSDGSDERHCHPAQPQPQPRPRPRVAELRATVACGKDQGPCRNRQCIPLLFFCDGEFDCGDGSDEMHCNKMAAAGEGQGAGAAGPHAQALLGKGGPAPWSEWSAWGPCSDRCEQRRMRRCSARGRGLPCKGPAAERRKCQLKDCQVDGGWSAWTAWTSCSVSCGKGTRRRYRKCDSPPPNYGGGRCLGSDGQQENCVQSACAPGDEGHWGAWGPWTTCSRAHNVTRVRRRPCEGAAQGHGCPGAAVERAPCHPCPRSLKIGLKPVRVTVTGGRLVNFTCHYRQRGEQPLSLELDIPGIPHSNEVIKSAPDHRILKDALTATRCGARRRWTLLLGGGRSLVRCVVRGPHGQVLGKAEARVFSVPAPPSPPCYGDKNCPEIGRSKKGKTWKEPLKPLWPASELSNKEKPILKSALPPGSPPCIAQVHPSFQVVRRGGRAHVVCLATGDPPLDVQWRADGREMSSDAITSGGHLQLKAAQPSDGGKYTCTATNSAGSAHSSATVVVI